VSRPAGPAPAPSGRRRALPAVLAGLLLAMVGPARAAPNATEAARIEQLIRHVAGQGEIQFVRNGQAYPAAEAAEHLRTKLRAAGQRIDTAEQFVDHLASRSSITGRPYRIRFADGREIDAGPWLRAALR